MSKTNLFLFFLLFNFFAAFAQTSKVEILQRESKWVLEVDGFPYYINGAGGETHLDDLVKINGNTIRTWGMENAQSVLDEAEKKGVKVMLGLWVQHERHGFDYNDEAKIKKQLEDFRILIRKYKNHPALLIWCVGNEYELAYQNTKVWKAVNDIAKMVKEEDPNHPTASVTAGTSSEKLKFVQTQLTDVDIYGINTYGDIDSVKIILKEGNFNGPYMITEWGPDGHWQSPKTSWKSSIEQTSKEKYDSYVSRYKDFIQSDSLQCIGSFAFLWGQKQEYTSTWYGVFTEQGFPTEVYDALAVSWSKKALVNNSPTVDSLKFLGDFNEKNLFLNPNKKFKVAVYAQDINKDKLIISWELFPESTDLKSGGDAESKPIEIVGNLKKRKNQTCKLHTPRKEGAYRLYVTISDGEKIAYANIPFYIGSLVEIKN